MLAVYIRVSSHSQKADSQRAEIEAWLTRHRPDPKAVRWFEDKETGSTMRRDGFRALEKAIFQGEVDTVLVWKLDRLARSFREGVRVITDWCQRGVRLVSVTQQIDLSGPLGQMVAGVLFAFAEMELQHSKERQAAGIAVAKTRGVYQGRKQGTTKAKPDRARELRDKGLTPPEIAAALQISERTVWRYLRYSQPR